MDKDSASQRSCSASGRQDGEMRRAGNGDIFFVFSFPEYMYMMDSICCNWTRTT